jgi:hypothetical protein
LLTAPFPAPPRYADDFSEEFFRIPESPDGSIISLPRPTRFFNKTNDFRRSFPSPPLLLHRSPRLKANGRIGAAAFMHVFRHIEVVLIRAFLNRTLQAPSHPQMGRTHATILSTAECFDRPIPCRDSEFSGYFTEQGRCS